MKPKARKEGIVLKQVADQTLLYDTSINELHSLNASAAAIWTNCDGKKSAGEIAECLCQQGIEANEASVELALEQLSSRNLLQDPMPEPSSTTKKHRREMLKVLTTALAIPVITSIVAPQARASASTTTTTTTTTTTPPPIP